MVTLACLVALFFWFWNIKTLYVNEKIVLVENLTDSRQCKKALELTNNTKWEKAGIVHPYAALRHADAIKKCTFAEAQKEVAYTQRAIDLLKTASKMQPHYSRTWLFLGAFENILAAREKDPEKKQKILQESLQHLDKARSLSPKRQEILFEYEKNYMLAENYLEMERVARECIDIDTTTGECYWYLGISQIFQGNQGEGKQNIALSKEKHYNNPAYLQLGVAYLSQKNYPEAKLAYEQLVALYPDNVAYHAVLAILYKEVGEFDKAAEQAKVVFKLNPEDPEAIVFIKSLIGLKPGDIGLHYALVDIYRSMGDTQKANAEIEKIKSIYLQLISAYPNEIYYHMNLAYVYQELGEFDNAYHEAIVAFDLDAKLAKVKEIESLIKLLPPQFADQYVKHLKNNPDKYFKAYGRYPPGY